MWLDDVPPGFAVQSDHIQVSAFRTFFVAKEEKEVYQAKRGPNHDERKNAGYPANGEPEQPGE